VKARLLLPVLGLKELRDGGAVRVIVQDNVESSKEALHGNVQELELVAVSGGGEVFTTDEEPHADIFLGHPTLLFCCCYTLFLL
jgi:hypothetical protein